MKLCFCRAVCDECWPGGGEAGQVPRSSRSPSMVTKSDADRRSSESMRQQRSISARSFRDCWRTRMFCETRRTRVAQAETICGTSEGE